ncbi:MAG: NUDIX domain-containing protein [Clostridia bacterium]|nr:NUDIX domain-containing protein [Clostridia bacterium]
MILELRSTEIAVLTPFGVIMQIRAYDHDQLGLWGGVLEEDEEPAAGAVRELKEETGLEITEEQLQFVEINEHFHEYANGDKAYFHSYRYILELDYVPKIVTDEESVGAIMVVHTILSHQQEFVKRVLGEIDN